MGFRVKHGMTGADAIRYFSGGQIAYIPWQSGSAEVNNVLSQYYDVVLNYPMPGRNYKLILKMEL
jgi:hypothetical protein